MKKIVLFLTFMIVSTALFAGGTENKINQSAGYVRFPAKNTECKKPDAMFYNPAGTAFLEDGLYFEVGNQFLYKEYANEINGKDYSSDVPTLLYPNFEVVWKKDKTALFTGMTVFAGGGALEYEKGNGDTIGAIDTMVGGLVAGGAIPSAAAPLVKNELMGHSLDVSSSVLGLVTGMSHQFWEDRLAVGAAVKILYGKQTREITLDNAPNLTASLLGTEKTLLDSEASGFGVGGILSVHYKPVDTIDLAVTYHTESIIDYEYTDVSGNSTVCNMMGAVEDSRFDYVIPAYLAFGIGWQATSQLYLAAGSNIYFNKAAEYDYDNAFEINFAGEYQINDMFAVSLGGFYTSIGCNSKDGGNSFSAPSLDSFTYCGGVEISAGDFTIDLGGFYVQYFEETWKNAELDKDIFEGVIGVTYKMF